MFCVIDCKHLHMRIFVNNSNILTTLNLYNIHQSSIRKSAFEIMNAQSYTINCLIWHFRIYACMHANCYIMWIHYSKQRNWFRNQTLCECLQRTEINIYWIYTYFELYHRKIFRSLNSSNLMNMLVIYHDFLPTPRRGSHVKSGKTHTQSSRYTP